ncbi:MAG: UDP-glucose/GDP-mannose dehydrogenase family protein [Thermomicrobiales bacterium]
MEITIFGTGYVGLVTGTCFAEAGNHVMGIDIDPSRIARLRQGESVIFEPGLTEMLQRNLKAGRIEFTTDAKAGIDHASVVFICVGTPPLPDGSSNLSAVEAVARTVGRYMSRETVVVDKSTVPVGTGDRVNDIIRDELRMREVDIPYAVISNPEFLKEGAAIDDFMRPDRIIVGSNDPWATELMRELYAPFNRNHNRLMVMDLRSAEFTKYAANALLATKISFMNEMANIAERIGVNIENVRVGIGSDPRIGYSFIYPGCGYGGSCFPKDVSSLEKVAESVGYDAQLVRAVNRVNDRQKDMLFEKIYAHFGGDLRGKTIALWGLAFKPNTDDMREAPSINLMTALWDAGAKVRAYDPVAMKEAAHLFESAVNEGDLILADDAESALSGADALAVCTEWRAFKMPDFDLLRSELRTPVIFDGRNMLDPIRVEREGLIYYGIGIGVNQHTRQLANA